ncbi:MAG: Gfo/Idh/MocA family oxidoreductase [Spirochaetaceae bacterium]|nr:Gfo/Idh/MocA family oxidoreductase [Spirochaetaceae bacterium]HPG26576.1 Gfo/Idh/MocA family oxidoreductase [Myxococcota bacterium]
MRETRVCVVGAGRMGTLHARTVARLAAGGEGGRLVGVVDRHPARAERVARALGARAGRDAAAFHGDVDAVIVAVPTADHVVLAEAALDAGLDVLVEKPLASDVASGRALVERAGRAGRLLQVGHVEWYEPAWRVAAERVGSIRRIEVERLGPPVERGLDIDVVQDFMLHDLDWTTRWLGGEVVSVEASGRRVRNALLDEAWARLELATGCVVELRASRVHASRRRTVRIEGTRGVAIVDLLRHTVQLSPGGSIECPPVDPLESQWRAFLEARLHGAPPENDGAVGVAALEWVARVQQAIDAHDRSAPRAGANAGRNA